MAKFSGKNIEFKDYQKAIFGTGDDSYIMWDPVDQELVISTTASGVDPIDPGHLVTKRYLDTTVSGYKTWHRINIASRGEIGTGGDWADEATVDSVPVDIFARNKKTKMALMYRVTEDFDLSFAPQIKIASSSLDTAPGSGDAIRWEMEVKYIALGEKLDKTPDETIYLTQTLDDDVSYQSTFTRNTDIDFTFDKTLISGADLIAMTLYRDPSNAADTFNGEMALSEIWFIYYGQL